jgi:RimJ/RimL family protein N-acetyltransferase
MSQIPTIGTSRIKLRAFRATESDDLHKILLNPNVLRYFPPANPPSLAKVQKLVESQQKHWQEYGFGWWTLALQGTDQLIGWCGLNFLPETDEVELKYLLAEEFWGRGIATEASRVSLDYALSSTDLNQIIGLVHPDNIASQRVLEKVGMSFLDRKEYFGMECFRYSVDRERLERDRSRLSPMEYSEDG